VKKFFEMCGVIIYQNYNTIVNPYDCNTEEQINLSFICGNHSQEMPWSSAWLLLTSSYDGAVTGVGSILSSNHIHCLLLSYFIFSCKENLNVIYRCTKSDQGRNEIFMNSSGQEGSL